MSRLIDADALLDALRKRKMAEVFPDWIDMSPKTKWRLMKLARETGKLIDAAPTVDAVPVIRCMECRYWRQEVAIGGIIRHWQCLRDRDHTTFPNEYCARGEKG